MSRRKSVIIMLILFLAIGFATVSTTLVLNGILAVGENKYDFNIIFTSARLDGRKRNDFISEDKKHINFVSNELKTLDDKAILTYEITNTSRNYDADITLTCTAGTTELITLEYTPHLMDVPAGETKTGTLTVSMLKLVDSPIEVPIEFTFTATAKTREKLGDEYIPPFSRSGVMKIATNGSSNPSGMWAYRSNITKIEFEDKLISHETTEDLTFDVSDKKDKSVMAYLIPNGELLTTNKNHNNKDLTDTTAYTLYIQGNTGVIANKDSSNIFAYFNNLKEIKNLQYMDTSNVTDMSNMFNNCSNLIALDLSNFDTSNVTDMYYMLFYCSNLTEIDLSNFDTSNVTAMYSMFYNCSNLTTLDVSNFDTSNVTYMESMFGGCSSLKELNIRNFVTNKVTNMSSMFSYCRNLTTLDVSNFDTSNVTNMSSMFSGCSSLKELNVENFITNKVTNMSHMFAYCGNLITLDVSKFDTSNVMNMDTMFASCSSLKELNVSNFITDKVTDMTHMFEYCSQIISLDLSNFNTSNVKKMRGMFHGSRNLKKLDLSNFRTSNLTDMFWMFARCNSLAEINISNFDVSNVTTIGGLFAESPNIAKVDISNWNIETLVDKEIVTKEAFTASKLTDVKIYVKDKIAQDWILSLPDTSRPSSWTTDNVVIKEAA